MKKNIKHYLSYLTKRSSPNEIEFSSLLNKIDFNIDEEYVNFIKIYNGGEGCFENGKCVLFWQIRDIINLNPYYKFIKECENLFFIGSDGSSLGYAFNKQNEKIVSIDLLDIGVESPVQIANSFEKFLAYLSKD